MQQLQLKNPDHHPSVPYQVQDVYKAVRFILQGAATMPALWTPANQGTIMDPTLKTEQLRKMFAKFTQTVTKAMNNKGRCRTRVNQEI